MENRFKYVSGWKKKAKAVIPRHFKYTFFADVIEFLIKKTSILDGDDEPPPFIEFGGGEFIPIGNALAQLMTERASLNDGIKIIDVGSGIGRNAVALSKLFHNIDYTGFDVVKYGVRWCEKRFSDLPQFRFIHANIYNSFYNPRGTESALTYRFPVSSHSAEFVFATSVFTHMPRAEVAHYLSEFARCMKPGGKAYFTCFVLDAESRQQIDLNKTLFCFPYTGEGSFLESQREPDLAVAFDDQTFNDIIRESGLEVVNFYPGHWRGLPYKDFQDAFVLQSP